MIEASASTRELFQHLRQRAVALAAAALAERHTARPAARHEWRSAQALWPDIFGENRDGK